MHALLVRHLCRRRGVLNGAGLAGAGVPIADHGVPFGHVLFGSVHADSGQSLHPVRSGDFRAEHYAVDCDREPRFGLPVRAEHLVPAWHLLLCRGHDDGGPELHRLRCWDVRLAGLRLHAQDGSGRLLRAAELDLRRGHVLLGRCERDGGPQVLSVRPRHLLHRRHALHGHDPGGHELSLHPNRYLPARHVLRAYVYPHRRPLLRVVRRGHVRGRRHALDSRHAPARVLRAADLDLPERHVLLRRSAADRGSRVHRLRGRELLGVEHGLGHSHPARHALRLGAVDELPARDVLLAAGNGDRRPRVLPLRDGHLLLVRYALGGAIEPRRRLRRADGDVPEGNILFGAVLELLGPRVHHVHDGHLRRDGLLVRLRHRPGHCLHDGLDDVPAWDLLRSRRNVHGRPLLCTLRCRHLLARDHALDAYDGAARWLRGAGHVLPRRNLLLGARHVHG